MPTYLQNYVISQDNVPFDEDVINFALFVNFDLVVYEEAAYDDRWIKEMENENHAIEKNDI